MIKIEGGFKPLREEKQLKNRKLVLSMSLPLATKMFKKGRLLS